MHTTEVALEKSVGIIRTLLRGAHDDNPRLEAMAAMMRRVTAPQLYRFRINSHAFAPMVARSDGSRRIRTIESL